jgi:hypothetical protein
MALAISPACFDCLDGLICRLNFIFFYLPIAEGKDF